MFISVNVITVFIYCTIKHQSEIATVAKALRQHLAYVLCTTEIIGCILLLVLSCSLFCTAPVNWAQAFQCSLTYFADCHLP